MEGALTARGVCEYPFDAIRSLLFGGVDLIFPHGRFAGPVSAAPPGQGMLESRLARLEAELDFIRSATRSHTARLDRLEDGSVGNSSSPGGQSSAHSVDKIFPIQTSHFAESSRSRSYHHVKKESQEFETFARDAFELYAHLL